MEASINFFKYDSLDSAAGDIRLLALDESSDFSSQISVHVFRASLQDPPPYEALSYIWGDAKVTRMIVLNGQKFAVTVNLEAALHHLRWKDRSRILWVDAVCIDQQNVDERGHQVARMRDIYRNAVGGLLWLGEDPGISKSALLLLNLEVPEDYKDAAGMVYRIISRQTKSQYKETLKELRKVLDDPPVWTRMWIVQETSCVKKLQIVLGPYSFEWITAEAIMEATRLKWHEFGSFDLVDGPVGILTESLFEQRTNYQNGSLEPFCELWISLAGRSCTDPRDSVFALLGLSQDLFDVIPTYDESFQTVFNKMTRHCITKNKNLDILTTCGPSSSNSGKLPSWVPDFADSAEMYDIAAGGAVFNYSAGIGLDRPKEAIIHASPDGNVLLASGVMLASIFKTIGPPKMELNWDSAKFKTTLNDMLIRVGEAGILDRHIQPENIIDGFWRTITLDLHFDFVQTNTIRRLTADDAVHMRGAFYDLTGLSLPGSSKLGIIRNLVEHLKPRRRAHRRQENITKLVENMKMATMQFCLTSNGSMAMVTDKAEVGDLLCILYGSRTPHIIRPVPGSEDAFQIIGIAYVHDFMDGQVLSKNRPEGGRERTFMFV